jgi:hypothetical protein
MLYIERAKGTRGRLQVMVGPRRLKFHHEAPEASGDAERSGARRLHAVLDYCFLL